MMKNQKRFLIFWLKCLCFKESIMTDVQSVEVAPTEVLCVRRTGDYMVNSIPPIRRLHQLRWQIGQAGGWNRRQNDSRRKIPLSSAQGRLCRSEREICRHDTLYGGKRYRNGGQTAVWRVFQPGSQTYKTRKFKNGYLSSNSGIIQLYFSNGWYSFKEYQPTPLPEIALTK